jgi:hypothetical protein
MCQSSNILKSFAVIAFLSLPALVGADESKTWDMTVDEIAKELSNPVTALAAFSNEFQYRSYKGSLPEADQQSGWIYELEASIPIPPDQSGPAGLGDLVRSSHMGSRPQLCRFSDSPKPTGHPRLRPLSSGP